jgi:RND family efflux transporter MFP subunit
MMNPPEFREPSYRCIPYATAIYSRPGCKGIIFAALAPLLAVLSGCSTRGVSQTPSVTETPVVVTASKAARCNLSGTLILTAEFIPYQEIDVMAKVAGYVKSIDVDMGDRVRAGQLIATLEVPEMADDMARAQAAVDQAEAQVTTAQRELQRSKSSHDIAHVYYTRIEDVAKREPGLLPRQEIDEVHSRDLVAEAQVETAEANLRSAEQHTRVTQAELARLKTLYRYTGISAPFSGVVTKRYANTGSMIQAGTASQSQAMPLVRLSQNDLLRLILPVPEYAVSDVRIGGLVRVRVLSANKTLNGRVTRFADKVQVSTRTMDTEVDVPNPKLDLVPGMYAEVTLTTAQHTGVVAVPPDAVDESGEAPAVYAVDASGTVHVSPVRIGLRTPHLLEILSGVDEGQTVIVGRRTGIREGQRVNVKIVDRDNGSAERQVS